MRRAISFVLPLIVLLTVAGVKVRAEEEARLSLDVNPRSGTIDQTYTFSVTVEGAQVDEPPYLVGGDDFKLTLMGPQSEVSIVNGVVSRRQSYVYRLMPTKEGELATPSAEITVHGKKLTAAALKIKVSTAGGSKPLGSDEVSVRQSIDPTQLYVGQQAINSVELYASIRIVSPQLVDMSYDDFTYKSISNDERSQRYINGTRYDIISIRRAIYPLRAGKLSISPRKIQAKVLMRTKSRVPGFGNLDPFGDDFFSGFFGTIQYEDRVVTSNSLSVAVQPLPEPPGNLPTWNLRSPLVGKTSLTVQSSSTPIKVGESKSVTIEVNSFGNLTPLNEALLKLPSWVKVYADTPEENDQENSAKLLSTKTFSLSLVPSGGGTVTVPSLQLGYFDPESSSYKVAEAPGFSFEVTGAPPAAPIQESTSKERPAPKIEPTTPPSSTDTAEGTEKTPLTYEAKSTWEKISSVISLQSMLMVLIVTMGGFGIIRFLIRWRKESAHSASLHRALVCSTNARELEKALRHFLCDKLSLPAELTTRRSLEDAIVERVPSQDVRFSILALFDQLESVQYGGKALPSDEFERLKERVKEVVGMV